VHDIGRVYTELRTVEGSVIAIPNSSLLSKTIENLSRAKRRVSTLEFMADPAVPLSRVREAAALAASSVQGVENAEITVSGLRDRQVVYRVGVTMGLETRVEEATGAVLHELARLVAAGAPPDPEGGGSRMPAVASRSDPTSAE
jgi:small-conductance mechanosensitive channel